MGNGLPPLIERAVEAATRAPSAYNTQPWRFLIDGDRIDVVLDRARVLGVADPDAREARLSCGAAVFNLCVSLRANGRRAPVRLLPDRLQPDLLAAITIEGEHEPSAADHALGKAVPRRHTNRRPFFERAVPAHARRELDKAAAASGARLALIEASARYDAIAVLTRRAEHIQATDERFQAETEYWTGRPAGHTDGVPAHAAGPPPDPDGALRLRPFRGGETLPARPYEQQPLLAALLTTAPGPRAEIQAGMALQHVLLTATTLGLAASFLSQPLEVPATCRAVADLFRAEGTVHALLRIGYGHPAAPIPRRPVAEVVTVRDNTRR
ncbi:hypothetical protein HFP15_02965 [Amycolatopsis sp. K13G38]|uniref:Nitroreductase n=2 Tax=Amycolatopsis acididurans TaxID=2724524 RepID=A0ABX1IWJ4_9PSEU|nr:hypothetical protein [Amycolatopsis acididurans]